MQCANNRRTGRQRRCELSQLPAGTVLSDEAGSSQSCSPAKQQYRRIGLQRAKEKSDDVGDNCQEEGFGVGAVVAR
jgi:hypothetical protein